MRLSVLYSALVSCLVSVPVLGAQSEDTGPMFEFHCVGLYNRSVSDTDRQMMDTVKLLKDRIVDLAEELDLGPIQMQGMLAGWDILTAGTAMRLDADENGIAASMIFEPGDAELETLYARLTGFAGMAEFKINERSSTASQLMGPLGPIEIEHDDTRLWLTMGEGEAVSMAVPRNDLPKGVEPVMSGRIDIGGLLNFFAPDVAEMIEQDPSALAAWNPMGAFIRPDAPIIEFGVGVNDTQMHITSRIINAGKSSEKLGLNKDQYFTADDFRRIPKDAVRITATQTSISMIMATLSAALEEIGSDEYEEFTEELGVDLIQDILGNMGDRIMYYQSDSTGGGGLLSAVLLVDLQNAKGFGNAHAKLVDRLNTLADDEVDGYVRVQTWRPSGINAFSVTTPGLPIPLEPSWAIDDRTLIVALSPGSLERAVAQIHMKSLPSIIDNASFQKAVLSRMPNGEVYAANYYDAVRLSKKGYGMTSMLTSALANMTRSPANPDRVVGAIIPDFTSFTNDIEPSGSVSWWDGDDFRTHYISDESMLVQLSAGLGSIADMQGVIVPAFAAGALLPALGKARGQANELKAAAQLRGILQGMIIYSSDNDDQFPESFEDMISQGILDEGMFRSPFGPAIDGRADYAIRSDAAANAQIFNARFILAIDRAMWVNEELEILVGFADTHVELIDRMQLLEMLALPINEGAIEAFDLPTF